MTRTSVSDRFNPIISLPRFNHRTTESHVGTTFTFLEYEEEVCMFRERTGLIVWVSDPKSARHLDRFGTVHYISKRMNYAVMYIYADRYEETVRQLQKQSFVRKVERSYRNEIKTEYNSNMPDKTRFYTY
jgi:uncharacterized protein YlbG (UPF0298 family)